MDTTSFIYLFSFLGFALATNNNISSLPIKARPFPVVLFPGYALSNLQVTLNIGHTLSNCPPVTTTNDIVSFVVGVGIDPKQSDSCVASAVALSRNKGGKLRNPTNVIVDIPGRTTGDVACINGFYQPLINKLVSIGLVSGSTLRFACYDYRTVPYSDVLGLDNPGFIQNTKNIIEATFASGGNHRVYLLGHSNGPIMASYFMKQMMLTDPTWINKYILGYIPIAANLGGQGLASILPAIGIRPMDFTPNVDWTQAHATWPANAMMAAKPYLYSGTKALNVLETTDGPNARIYSSTVADYNALFQDIGDLFMRTFWQQFSSTINPLIDAPYVYTFALYGSGLDTVAGMKVSSLPITDLSTQMRGTYNVLGDSVQPAVDNEAILNWGAIMESGCFEYQEFPGVSHFDLVSKSDILDLIASKVKVLPPALFRGSCSIHRAEIVFQEQESKQRVDSSILQP